MCLLVATMHQHGLLITSSTSMEVLRFSSRLTNTLVCNAMYQIPLLILPIFQENIFSLFSLLFLAGTGFQSKGSYLFGHFSMHIKMVPGDSAGTVTAFYVSPFIHF